MGKIYSIFLISMMLIIGIAEAYTNRIDKDYMLERRAEKLARVILKAIKHEVHVVKQGGKTVAYGKIVLKKEPNKKILQIHAGASNKIYVGYEVVSLDRTVTNPSSGYVKIYGYVGTYVEGAFRPLEGVIVEIWEIDGDGTKDQLGSVSTDSSGYFEWTGSSQDGWLGAYGTQDIWLKFFLDTPYAVIQRSGSTYWAEMPDDKDETGDGVAVSIYLDDDDGDGLYNDEGADGDQGNSGTEDKLVKASDGWIVRYVLEEGFHARNIISFPYTISNPDPAGAAQILWYIQQAARFMQSAVGITPPKIYVEFSDAYATTHYDVNTGKLYVSGYASGRDWEDMSLVLKEYAKFLLQQYSVLSSSSGFDWSAHTDEQTAWVEGFGAYFASAVKQYSGISSPYIYDDYPNTYNLETQYDDDDSLNDADVCGAVAGILWDLDDSANDDQDGDGVYDYYDIPFSYIWDVVDNDNPTTIVEFWNGLKNRYSVDSTAVWEIYWEHGVNLDTTAPSAPTITNYDPNTGVWVSQNWIWISWSASTDDMSGIKRYLVIVYKDGSYYDTYDAGTSLSYNITNLPTGSYYVKVRAEDRAGNTADSTQVGPFKLDTTPPSYSGQSPTGTIYDSKSDDIVLTITWTDVGGGVTTVKFRYKYGSGAWTTWQNPSSQSGDTYYFSIAVEEWKQHIGEYLYWESYAVDVAGNTKYTVTFSAYLDDDDKDGPSISGVSTSGDIYDSASEYIIQATITDPSGVASVQIVWKFEGGTWNYWDATYVGDDIYQITIDKSNWESTELWNGRNELLIYYYIVATDGDNDRPNDDSTSYYGSESSPVYAGKIYDDDPDPPSIVSIETTGNIYDNYTDDYKISVTLSDATGVSSVKIYWSFDNATWTERVATQYLDTWYILISRSEWANAPEWENSDSITIYYYIWAIDSDADRVYDQSETQTSPSIAGTITDDDSDSPSVVPRTSGIIYDNTSRPYYINATITDKSGLSSVLFRWSFNQSYWYEWTPNRTGDLYWIEIDKSLWASEDLWINRTYISIYYQIIATDADNDRSDDTKTTETAIDEAGKIYDDDTSPPSISNIRTTGLIYDDYDGAYYINATITDSSGIYNVTFYWRIENLSWNAWAPTGVEGTDEYYIAIDKSLWGSSSAWEGRTYITIYYYIVSWDADQDRAHDQLKSQTETDEAGKIYDDDTTAPSIQSVTTSGVIYDNHTGPFFINATITDESGLSNVTIKWSFDNTTWNAWQANNTEDKYWIAIDKSLWASTDVWEGKTYIVIYYQIVAVDGDFDRPDDELTTITAVDIAGKIYDDDTEPPEIYSVETSGIMYDNSSEPFYINATILDDSGLSNVTIKWSINNGTWYSWEASNDGNIYYIAIDKSIWASSTYWEGRTYITIYYQIVAIDNDNDRSQDSLMTITEKQEAGKIYDDDTEAPSIDNVETTGIIYDNYTGSFYINITLSDKSGIYNATIYYSFDNTTWYFMNPNVDGDTYWIAINREIWSSTSAWENSSYITIYYYIIAYDNDNDRGNIDRSKLVSSIGEAGKIYDDDTTAPEITSISFTGNDTGYIYDNYPGDIYINATIDDESGIYNVTFYWRFNNGTWNEWDPYNEGNLYYIIIGRSLWATTPEWTAYQLTIYYRIVTWDADQDRIGDQLSTDTGVNQGPVVYDDDTTAPSISQVTFTGNDTDIIYDDYPGSIFINATITDESGIDNATFYWRFNDGEWNAWTPNNDGDLYWIEIPRDVWAQSPYWYATNLTLYYRIVARDADMDRPNDQLESDTGVHPGTVIVDDDDEPPSITQVTWTGNDTGMIYDDYPGSIFINATITDESGIDNVTFYWRFNDGEWNAWTPNNDEGSGVYWIAIDRSLWASTDEWYATNLTIYYRIVARDADMDRPNDQLESDTGVHPGPFITDDDTNPPVISNITTTGVINDSYYGDFYINCSVYDESGVGNVSIMWRIGNGTWFNTSVNFDGEKYWSSISRSIWASSDEWMNSSAIIIYYRIVAWDADADRPKDSTKAETGVQQAGMIIDDDSEGPTIHSIYFEDMDMDGYLESDETFSIVVEASDISGIKNITVSLYMDGSLIGTYVLGRDITYVDGKYVTDIIGPVGEGVLDVIVFAEDNDNDRDKYDTATTMGNRSFDIELETLMISVSPLNVHVDYGDILILEVTVEDSDGSYAVYETPAIIKIYNGTDVIYEAEFVAGLYNTTYLSIPINFAAGMWYMSISAGDMKYYESTMQTSKLYVHQKTELSVGLGYDRLVQYEDVTIYALLVSEDNTTLENRNITFYIGAGDDWRFIGTSITNASGWAVLNWVVDHETGFFYIKAVFGGEEYYYESEATHRVEIVESEATISILAENNTITCTYSDPANISLRLYNWRTGEPISNELVEVYIVTDTGEILLGSDHTGGNGVAIINIARIDLAPGKYVAVAKWGGNDMFSPTQTRFFILVDKETIGNIDIELSPSTVRYSDPLSILIYVVDDDGEPVTGLSAEIIIYEGDTPIDSLNLTIEDGTAEASWPVVGISYAPQTLSLGVYINENAYYRGASKRVTFDVEQEEVTIKVSVEEPVIMAEETTIRIEVTDDEGTPVDYIDVKVYVDDVLYKEDVAINGRLDISWTPSREGVVTLRIVVGEENPCYKQVEKKMDVKVVSRKAPALLQNVILGATAALSVIGFIGLLRKRRKKEIEGIEEEAIGSEITQEETTETEIEDLEDL